MQNKRGLSAVVTTVIIIVVSLVALAIIGVVVFNLVNKGANKISLSQFTVDLSLKSATVDFQTGASSVAVQRNSGAGDLVGIKFIFEDNKNSEVFDRRVIGFDELESHTFSINVTENGSQLVLPYVEKVSIAPIIRLDSGEEIIGRIADSVGGLNEGVNASAFNQTEDPGDQANCEVSLDCGIDYFLDGTKYCDGNNVLQYKREYSCLSGFCSNEVNAVFLETCGYQCYDGMCIDEDISCNNETDCGIDQYIGVLSCSQTGDTVVQNYKDYSCVDNVCHSTISLETIETCNSSEVCFQGECFVPLECVEHIDCNPGQICDAGTCVTETEKNGGTVNSIWPFGIGEYFDSANLTDPSNESYAGYYIFFPGSTQQGCLTITEHNWLSYPSGYPYIRLNETQTNISNGNTYSIWETDYQCTLL